VLEETVDELVLLAEVAGIALVLELPPELPLVLGDGPRLRQVARNLISNAVKFTPAGGQVTVSAAVEPGWLVMRVRDTGVGISPEHQEHIFERFYQVDTVGAHGRFQGQGLGLAIVRIITEGHGGSVAVESAPGAGSTFIVRLPLAEE
jgi:signal transduction histidine kinase